MFQETSRPEPSSRPLCFNAAGAGYSSLQLMLRAGLGLTLWLTISLFATAAESTSISLRWNTNAVPPSVDVAGLDTSILQSLETNSPSMEQWQRILSVHVGPNVSTNGLELPPMLGRYQVENGTIRFWPRFPLRTGLTYRAIFRLDELPGMIGGSTTMISTLHLPAMVRSPTTVVSEVFPSGEVLPENLLKFYLHFSAPMQGGHIHQYIHLLDGTGQRIELPFLELDEELWNPEMTRLTLFIDPGRIKRGVKPLEDIGPALEKGKRYTLEIDADWHDNAGLPLSRPFRKSFRVGAADRKPLDPDAWKIKSPKPGTREALTVQFSESLDHALALRVISVVRKTGEVIHGTCALSDHEKRWSFVPESAWSGGPHELQVQNTIEDLAGNNIGKVFDVDLSKGKPRRFTNEVVRLRFEVK